MVVTCFDSYSYKQRLAVTVTDWYQQSEAHGFALVDLKLHEEDRH